MSCKAEHVSLISFDKHVIGDGNSETESRRSRVVPRRNQESSGGREISARGSRPTCHGKRDRARDIWATDNAASNND